jgi:hypothetical protein
VPAIVDWLLRNWESYVGVSFIYRNDPTKTAADLGLDMLRNRARERGSLLANQQEDSLTR